MAAEPAVLALPADRADVVIAFAHLGHQVADFFGRVLQVGVKGNNHVAATGFEARHDRHVLAKVAIEQHHSCYIRAPGELLTQDGRGAVARTVVDEDDLVTLPHCIKRRIQAREQRVQAVFFVVNRDNDRNGRLH